MTKVRHLLWWRRWRRKRSNEQHQRGNEGRLGATPESLSREREKERKSHLEY